jgi:thromboxane-A synthase/cytochrome P450 family 3 subfamily A
MLLCPQFPYTEAIVREALRLYPPATLLNRRIKAGGFAVSPDLIMPEGSSLFPFLYGYQRSPEYWPAAEQFRPERWLLEGKHLAPTTPDAWTPFGRWAMT